MSTRPRRWLWFLDHTNITVTFLTASFLLFTRSAGVAYFSLGATCCSFTVKVVKRLVRQPRPVVNHSGKRKRSYGMPSTHAATITYFMVYTVLASAYLPIHPSLPDSVWTRIVPPVVVLPWGALIAVSRVWLDHHTWGQVSAGVLYGTIFAGLAFSLWTGGGLNLYGRVIEAIFTDYYSGLRI